MTYVKEEVMAHKTGLEDYYVIKNQKKHPLINLTFLIYPEYLLKYFCTKKPIHFRTGLLHFMYLFNK